MTLKERHEKQLTGVKLFPGLIIQTAKEERLLIYAYESDKDDDEKDYLYMMNLKEIGKSHFMPYRIAVRRTVKVWKISEREGEDIVYKLIWSKNELC